MPTNYMNPSSSRRESKPVNYMRGAGASRLSTLPIEEEDDGFGLTRPFSEFGRGLWSSLTSGNIEMLGGAAEAFSAAGGNDPEQSLGRKAQQWIRSKAEGGQQPLTWDEATGEEGFQFSDLMGALSYAGGLTGQGVGSMAAPLAAGAAGGAAGGAMAGPAGAAVGGFGAAFSVGSMLNIGETYLQLRDEGIDPKEAANWALGAGTAIGAVDTVALGRLLGATVLKEVKQKSISAFVKQAAKGYARGATEEGVTEMAQSAVREGLAAALTGNADLEKRALSALQEGLAGALGGGLISGVKGGVDFARTPVKRQTLSDTRADEDPGRPDLNTGSPMDADVQEGAKVIAKLLGDEESNSLLGERGVPAIGAGVVYRTGDSEQRGNVTGFVPADDDGPDSLVITDAEGLETVVDLPLTEGSSITEVEQDDQQREADEFVQGVNELVEGQDEQTILRSMLEDAKTGSLNGIPEDQRQSFTKDLKSRIDAFKLATEDDQKAVDDKILFDEDIEDVRGSFPEGEGFGTADTTVREKLGLEAGADVPPARRKTYLQLLKKHAARATKAAKAAAPKKPTSKKPVKADLTAAVTETEGTDTETEGTDTKTSGSIDETKPEPIRTAPAKPRPADAPPHVPEVGRADKVVIQGGKTYDTRYEVVDAADLVASNTLSGGEVGAANPNYNPDLQPRNLSATTEREKINQMVREGVDPVRLGTSQSADFGAPLVAEDNHIESGNGRTLALMIAYGKGEAQDYRKMVDSIADTSGMTMPVIIRRRVGDLPIAERRKLTKDANRSTAARLSTTDQAISDAEVMGDDIFGLYAGGELDSTANTDFIRKFIEKAVPVSERNEVVNEKLNLSPQGVARLEGAIVAKAYQSRKAVADLVADSAPDRKSVRNVLVAMAPRWAKMRTRISKVDAQQDVTQSLMDAVSLISRSVTEGKPVQFLFAEQDMFADDSPTAGPRGEMAKQILKWFYSDDPFAKSTDAKTRLASQQAVQANMERFIDAVDSFDPNQGTMFGPVETPVQRLMAGHYETQAAGAAGGLSAADPSPVLASVQVKGPDDRWRKMSDEEFSALSARIREASERLVPQGRLREVNAAEFSSGNQTVLGTYVEGTIQLAMRATDAESTLRHESLHALIDMGMVTQDEVASLRRAAERGNWVNKHRIAEVYPDAQHATEAITHEFEAWWVQQQTFEAKRGDSVVARVFKRIARFLDSIRTAIDPDKKHEKIFRRIESGEVGARQPGTGRPRHEGPLLKKKREPQPSTYKFTDKKAEEAYRRGQKSMGKPGEGVREFVTERMREIGQSFTRVYKDLPQNRKWGRVHTWLRELKAAPTNAERQAGAHLKRIVEGLDAREHDLLQRAVFVQSLAINVKRGINIPLFENAANWKAEMKALQAELQKPENKLVQKRIRRRRAANKKVATKLVEAGIIPKDSLDDQDYITHRVLEYETEQVGLGRMADVKTPKWKRRKGTKLDISTNFLETEAMWMQRALVDTPVADTIKKLKDSDYNYRDDLVAEIKAENRSQLDALVSAEAQSALGTDFPKTVKASSFDGLIDWIKNLEDTKQQAKIRSKLNEKSPLFAGLQKFRVALALRFSGMSKSLADVPIGEIPKEHRKVLESLRSDVDADDPPWAFLQWVANGELNHVDPTLSLKAAGLFSVFADRRAFQKQALGSEWLSNTNMANAIKMLTRRGHEKWVGKEAWQPDEGNLMFSAQPLAERVMDKASALLAEQIAEDPKLAALIDKDLRSDVADLLKGATLMGGPKYQLVLDTELATTLRSFKDDHLTSDVNTVLRHAHRAWKTMMTIFPTKIIKYNIRNVSGDIDHVNSAMGRKALKPADIAAAWKELWNVSFNGQEPTADYEIAVNKAVLDAGYSLEIWLSQKQGIDDALAAMAPGAKKSTIAAMESVWQMIQKPISDQGTQQTTLGSKAKSAWHNYQQVNNIRENVMRLVVFRKMREHIATKQAEYAKANDNATMDVTPDNIDFVFSDIGFGATHKELMRGQDDWDSVAAFYSRDTLGDYGNLSVAGRLLRATAIPFWSWSEINAKFYRRTFVNVKEQWRDSEKGIADPKVAAAMARAGASTGKLAAGLLVGRAFQIFVLQQAWNHLMFGEEEEELTDSDQRRGHIIIGKIGDEILMLPSPGALSDVARWIGMEDALAALDHVRSGRGEIGDVFEAIASGFVNTVTQGVTPIVKMPLEMLLGIETFPDVTTPRQMRSRTQYMIRGLGLDVATDLFGAGTNTGRPTQGGLHILSKLLVDRRPADYAAYSQVRSLGYKFKDHVQGGKTFLGAMTPEEEALYNYRLSLRFGDSSSSKRWRQRMLDLKITTSRRREMLQRAKPLGMLTQKQKRQFLGTLTPADRRALRRAEVYWRETYAGK